jgi:hypothetical protein
MPMKGRLIMREKEKRGNRRLVQYGNSCFVKCAYALELGKEGGRTRMIFVVIRPKTNVIVRPMSINCPSFKEYEYGLRSQA